MTVAYADDSNKDQMICSTEIDMLYVVRLTSTLKMNEVTFPIHENK